MAWVDGADYPLVAAYIWRAVKKHRAWYAVTDRDGRTVGMHDLILPPPSGLEIDHCNGNSLWNFRWNLRAVTHAENMRNSRRCVGGACLQKMLEHEVLTWEEREERYREVEASISRRTGRTPS
jgi:hypothetical protein